MELHGFCDDRFSKVRDAFEKNFAVANDLGASASVTVDGETVVDLWAGDANEHGDPWQEDTIVNVYSTTKTMAGLCLLMLADRGQLDFEAPVASYWPEFAAHGKERVLVSHVMSHQAGLPGFDPPLEDVTELHDHERIAARLAAAELWWAPGGAVGYHAITQGYLQAEILRRIDGRTLGRFFADEVARPLDADFHIGLPPDQDHRVGDLVPPPPPARSDEPRPARDSLQGRMNRSSPLTALEPRTRAWRGAEIPAAGGIGNARSVARVHGAMACGGSLDLVELLSPAGVAVALEEQCVGTDQIMRGPARFGMGYGLNIERASLTPGERSFYWGGWGGSLAVIDLEHRLSVAYVMNRMSGDLMGDVRGVRVVRAAYAALGLL